MNDNNRDLIAAQLIRHMNEYNKRMGSSTIEENVDLFYLCGAEMVLLYANIPYQLHKENGRYTGLTLNGVSYNVEEVLRETERKDGQEAAT